MVKQLGEISVNVKQIILDHFNKNGHDFSLKEYSSSYIPYIYNLCHIYYVIDAM